MKIAICLSGQPRVFDRCTASILALFPNHEVNVFCHFWEDAGASRAVDDFGATDAVIEPQREFSDLVGLVQPGFKRPINVLSMAYSLSQANDLRRSHEAAAGIQYDAVLRCRTDMLFARDLTEFLDELTPNHVVMPHHANPAFGLYDCVALADAPTMDLYAGLYQYAGDLLHGRKTAHWSYALALNPHVLLQGLLMDCRVEAVQRAMQCLIHRQQHHDMTLAAILASARTPKLRHYLAMNFPS